MYFHLYKPKTSILRNQNYSRHIGMGYLGENFNEHYLPHIPDWDHRLAEFGKRHFRSFEKERIVFRFGGVARTPSFPTRDGVGPRQLMTRFCELPF